MTGPARRRGNGARWATGKCLRGHDVTNPANVGEIHRSTGRVDRVCLLCRRYVERERRAGRPVEVPAIHQDRACENCGTAYSPTWGDRKQRARRRYCSRSCWFFARAAAWQALAEAELAREEQRRPRLDEAELARLRRMVGGVA